LTESQAACCPSSATPRLPATTTHSLALIQPRESAGVHPRLAYAAEDLAYEILLPKRLGGCNRRSNIPWAECWLTSSLVRLSHFHFLPIVAQGCLGFAHGSLVALPLRPVFIYPMLKTGISYVSSNFCVSHHQQ